MLFATLFKHYQGIAQHFVSIGSCFVNRFAVGRATWNSGIYDPPSTSFLLRKQSHPEGKIDRGESTSTRLLRLLATLGAKRQIVINRLTELFAKLFNGTAYEGNHVAHADYLAVKNIPILVESREARISLMLHFSIKP